MYLSFDTIIIDAEGTWGIKAKRLKNIQIKQDFRLIIEFECTIITKEGP